MNNLTQYLNEMKAELQELYDNIEHELRATDNQELLDNGFTVVETLSSALTEMEVLIGDIDNGIYNDNINNYNGDGMLEDEGY